MAFLIFGFALLAGLAWARLLPGRLVWPERLAAGSVVGMLAGAWLSWLAVVALGFGAGLPAAAALLLGVGVAGWWWGRRRTPARGQASCLPTADGSPPRRGEATPLPTQPLSPAVRRAWLATTGGASLLLGYLYSTHFLPPLAGGMGSAGSTWGDLAMHASLTARFAQESRFEWELPLFAGAPLTYPFLPDFWSGVLHRSGFSLRWALLAPTMVLALALVQLLFFFGWRASRGRGGAVLTVLVLLDGSAAGLPVLWREWRQSGQGLLAYLRDVRHDFAHVPAINLRFSNIVCDALLPQRGMLAGFSAFLLGTLLLRAAWEEEASARGGERAVAVAAGRRARGALAGVAVILGALPFVHVHTFLVLAGVLAWMAAARRLQRRAGAWRWAASLGGGVLLAVPQLAWQLGHSYGRSFSHWHLGWMSAPGENPFAFWLRNLGVLLPFLVAAPWWLRRWPARGFWLHLLAPCLALFAVANVYLFQPHAYDNLKLLFYAYLALAAGTARLLTDWWRRGRAARVTAALVTLLATGSGAASVLREATLHWPLLDADEVALGMALRAATPPEARFLTADRHNHPVPIVAGRRIVLGYRGWLWTYGLDTARVLADVRAIYRGDGDAPALLRRYGVDYVVVGPAERRSFAVDEQFFARRYPLLLQSGRYRVYSVGGAKTGVPAGSLPAKRSASK
ncbi:MAG TPA: hypothetical protein VGV61_19235 [Thermoanaerobaculia bacterium]|jgi:hypothetical protein|nr:hypothetical protein [Thermoanaerobaculia bacterium]